MAGRITSDGANYVLNLITASEPPVPFYYVALISGSAPSYSAKGDELNEPTNAEYARAKYQNISGDWVTQSGVAVNFNEVLFPISTTDWGQVRYWAICDSLKGGRVFWVGNLANPIATVVGGQFYLPAGSLALDIPNSVWKVYL